MRRASWTHRKRGTLRSGEFIALAEEAGLARALGEWAATSRANSARIVTDDFSKSTVPSLSRRNGAKRRGLVVAVGCTEAQGYYYGPAVGVDDQERLLEDSFAPAWAAA